jgi:hypothetical protein
LTEINICGYGIAVYYSKLDVHGFFTKNQTKERKITELTIQIGKSSNPRINYTKRWTPLYKTTISWDNSHAEIWDLINLLEQIKGIKFKIDNKTNYVDVFHRLPDNIRSTIFRTIEGMHYNNSGYGDRYSEEDENYKNFITETVIEKW